MGAAVPPLRERPMLTMKDMGMDHGAASGRWIMRPWRHGSAPSAPAAPMDHGDMNMRDKSKVDFPVGPGVDMIAPMPVDRTGEPGLGLENVGHSVLIYRDLVALEPQPRPARRRRARSRST